MSQIREALLSTGWDSWCLSCSELSLILLFVIRNWAWPEINLPNIQHFCWGWWGFIHPDRDGRSPELAAPEIPLVLGLGLNFLGFWGFALQGGCCCEV